jgi:SpoVK/Ycf46/Vps4 family AAA+-type ATPase
VSADPLAGQYIQRALAAAPAAGNAALDECWRRIIVPAAIKERLLNHVLLALEIRGRGIPRTALPLHGLIVLSGPPGVGKSTLARGVAGPAARHLDGRYGPLRIVEMNPHLLPSELLGRTQRNVISVFKDELPALAGDNPAVLVLDDMEVLGIARSRASLSVNPVDVHRGTAALLTVLDWLSWEMPRVVVVGTTNLPGALDDAVLSRADVTLDVQPPGRAAVEAILADTLRALGGAYPGCGELAEDPRIAEVAALLDGCDGRQARKFIGEALALRTETALHPDSLTAAVLLTAARTWRAAGRPGSPADAVDG